MKPALLLLPEAIPLSIPLALPLGIACGVSGTRITTRRLGSVLFLAMLATPLAFAAPLAAPPANQAFRVAMAQELGMRGITRFSLAKGPNELSSSELAATSRDFDNAGLLDNARRYRRVYHLRFALPAAAFVLTLFAIGTCRTLRGRAPRIVALVVAVGAYWAMLAIAEWDRSVPAALSVWAPNIIVAAISFILLTIRARFDSSSTSPAAGN